MEEVIKSPLKAIRKNCLECVGCSIVEVKLCPVEKCPLWPFRFGKNPYTKRNQNLTEEQKEKIAERLKKAREAKGDN